MRLFGKVDGVRDRLDRPFTFRGLPFDIEWRPPIDDEVTPAPEATFQTFHATAPRLGLTVHEYRGGPIVGDWTRARGVVLETGQHGFGMLSGFLPLDDLSAFGIYQAERAFHVASSDGLSLAWEGRLEDISIVEGGLTFGAFGYWRALSDLPYTGMFVETRLSAWSLLSADEVAESLPDRFEADNNNRLYAAPTGGEKFGSGTAWCVFGYRVPDQSEEQIQEVSFNYRLDAPANWRIRLDRRAADWSLLSTVWTLDGTGSLQESSQTVAVASCAAVTISFFYNDTTTTFSGDTGDVHMRITQPKVQSRGGMITAKDVVAALVEAVSDVNPTQLSDSLAGIGEPGVALAAEVYEDLYPADILSGLGSLGDDQTPPRRWTAAVWEDQLLSFAPEGERGRTWYVDILEFELERSLDVVRNEMYTVFNGAGRSARTAVVQDMASQRRLGLIRRGMLSSDTSSQTKAENVRDLALDEQSRAKPRARIITRGVFDSSGVAHPLYSVRAGDVLVLRNLPANTFGGIDDVRSFRLAATHYDCENDELTPTPAEPLTTLEMVIARRERSI